jgi:hypothetical protein
MFAANFEQEFSMISTLSFAMNPGPIKFPPIVGGYASGLRFQLWVRRTGTAARQRIIELGNGAGTRLVLETGDLPDSLTLGVERDGAGRTEITALGALPQNRWVQVTAVVPASGNAWLALFSTQAACGPISLPISGDPLNVRIGGGLRGNLFVGQLSSFEIWMLNGTGPATKWGAWTLDQAVLDHTDQTVSPPVNYFRVDDTTTNNHDGTFTGAVALEQFPSPLNGPPVQILESDGTGSPLRISPITGISGGLSMEAWIRPNQVTSPQAILALATTRTKLFLVAGGSQQELSLVIVGVAGTYTVLLEPQSFIPSVWSHVALTLQQDNSLAPIVCSLYVQGQLRESVSVPSTDTLIRANPFAGWDVLDKPKSLEDLLHAQVLASCSIGGRQDTIGMFNGRMSEVRIWSAALSATDISCRLFSRVTGSEPSLAAGYRLEYITDGCTHDISPARGMGSLPTGCKLVTAYALPLYPTSSTTNVSIKVRGKLVTETVLHPESTHQETIGLLTQTVTNPPTVKTVNVFDTTIEPQSPDGSSLGGQNLQILPDDTVTVMQDQGDFTQPTRWDGGKIQSIPLPMTGKIRLRFVATNLSCPTLRMRIDGMPDGIWTLIRPDAATLKKLQSVTQQDLLAPANGTASPLPGGATSGDAETYVQVLNLLGRAVATVPPPPTITITPQVRSILSDIKDVYHDTVNTVVNTYEQVVSVSNQVLNTAGSVAGSLASALVDNGSTLLSTATVTVKTAEQLIVKDASALNDLVQATAQATARFGQNEIATSIASANSLAIVTTTAAGELLHHFAVIGTSIVSGATVAWRVICAGVKDALAVTKAWLNRVGADVKKFIEYLAYLFNWGDFLAASDDAYAVAQSAVLGQVSTLIDGLSQYKEQMSKLLTLPQGLGDKSLAQLVGLNINPNNPVLEELDYVFEVAQKVMNSQNLAFDGFEQLVTPLLGSLTNIDLSAFSGPADGFVSGAPSDTLSSPLGFVTTPIQSLLNSALTGNTSTSFIDFFFSTLIGGAKSALSVAQTLLCSRINIPYVTSWIEKSILGGRPLTVMRLISLCAAIPKVLAQKIISGNQRPQPQSFADDSPLGVWGRWLKIGFGALFSVLISAEAVYEKTVGEKAQKGTIAEKKAFHLGLACFDLSLGLINVGMGIIDCMDDMNLDPSLRALKDSYSAMHIIEGGCLAFYAAGLIYDAKSEPDNGVITLANILKAFHVVASFTTTTGSIIFSICIGATPGALSTDTDKSLFALKAGAHIVHLASIMLNAVMLISGSKGGALAKVVPVLGAATFLLELASAVTEVSTM